MILIIGKKYKSTIAEIISMLVKDDIPHLLISSSSIVKFKSLSLEKERKSILFEIDGREIDMLNDFSSVWMCDNKIDLFFTDISFLENSVLYFREIKRALRSEMYIISDYLKRHFYSMPKFIGPYQLNKLTTLEIARRIGFNIPSIVVTQKREVVNSLKWKTICKSIGDIFWYDSNEICIKTRTLFLDEGVKNDIRGAFFPSLLQEYINQEYEITVFYVNGRCYSLAKIANIKSDSIADYRVQSSEFFFREVPYLISKKTERNVRCLMNRLKLKFGLVDLILGKDGVLYFLEVNPLGDISKAQSICNFDLHKELFIQLTS